MNPIAKQYELATAEERAEFLKPSGCSTLPELWEQLNLLRNFKRDTIAEREAEADKRARTVALQESFEALKKAGVEDLSGPQDPLVESFHNADETQRAALVKRLTGRTISSAPASAKAKVEESEAAAKDVRKAVRATMPMPVTESK